MATAASYLAIINRFNAGTREIQWYFDQLPVLVTNHPYEVAIAYMFLRAEKAQNQALYCGVVKLHRADSTVADAAVNTQYLTRDGFLALYKNVFGQALSAATAAKIKDAEKIRDRVVHGKSVPQRDLRQAIIEVIEYAESMNSDINAIAGFQPFGDLRGFKGRAQGLQKPTTRWLLKGLGFAIA